MIFWVFYIVCDGYGMHVWIGGDKQGDEFVWTTGTLTIVLNMSIKM